MAAKDPADQDLWEQVKAGVVPLDRKNRLALAPPRNTAPSKVVPRAAAIDLRMLDGLSPPPQAIDRRAQRKIAKGRQAIDSVLDLHGDTQDRALGRLKAHIGAAFGRGERTILVVTGKGGRRYSQTAAETPVAYRRREDFQPEGGVLKRMVPLWLDSADLRPYIHSFSAADPRHGGSGALYVRLRKRR